jgi:hypothetical protein
MQMLLIFSINLVKFIGTQTDDRYLGREVVCVKNQQKESNQIKY